MKTAGPSGLLEPPPMVMPKLLDRATEMSWITPSPGWLKTQRHISLQSQQRMCLRLKIHYFSGSRSWVRGTPLSLHCWPFLSRCDTNLQNSWVECKYLLATTCSLWTTGEQCGGWCGSCKNKSYLRERSMGPLLLYMFWEPAGLNNKGLWERDEDPDDVLSR